jgi:hypothetical protein
LLQVAATGPSRTADDGGIAETHGVECWQSRSKAAVANMSPQRLDDTLTVPASRTSYCNRPAYGRSRATCATTTACTMQHAQHGRAEAYHAQNQQPSTNENKINFRSNNCQRPHGHDTKRPSLSKYLQRYRDPPCYQNDAAKHLTPTCARYSGTTLSV